MADDKQMAEEDLENGEEVLDGGLDFEAEESEDLESAMQEALEAVEKASETARARRESGDEIRPPATEESDPETQGEVARLEETVAELRDRSKRTLADFENFRRRVDRERQDDRRYAAFDVLKEFLAVVDNLERALASGGSTDDFKVGVELIHRQMKDLMRNSGVERIEAIGEEFDPRFHEAVTYNEDPGVVVPTVDAELQAGYTMHDRLLRPSVVKVAMPKDGSEDGDADV